MSGDVPPAKIPLRLRARMAGSRVADLPLKLKLLLALALLAVALLVAVLLAGAGSGGQRTYGAALADPVPYDGRSPAPPTAARERVLVQLPRPALGELDGVAKMDAAAQRAYVASLRQEAKALISALDADGVQLRDVVTYTRAWHGFAATVSERDLPGLGSLGVRVRPDRRLFPAFSAPVTVDPEAGGGGASVGAQDGPEVTLLAGGAPDARDGYDAVGRDDDPSPARDEDGGTPLAAELRALGMQVRVVRVSARRRDSGSGGADEHGRTDELLDGLEHVVDPDGDGDTSDHDRVALIGVCAPYAGFADAPDVRALRGARRLGTLVVAPSGHEGPGDTAFGTIGSPGAAPDAVTVTPRSDPGAVARTMLTVGDVTVRGAAVLAGAPPARVLRTGGPVDADTAVALLHRRAPRLQGRLAVVRAGANPTAQVAAAAAAGAAAVLLAQPEDRRPLPTVPVGRVDVPVLGVTGAGARAVLALAPDAKARASGLQPPRARAGVPFGTRRISPFASRGPTYAGLAKPELARAGSVVVDGRLVAGAAVAAAQVAAEAAKLGDRSPAELRKRLVGPTDAARRAGAVPSPTPAAPPAVPVGTPALRREGATTGVAFTVGSFRRGDAAAGQPTSIVPAARLVLTLQRADGTLVERLTPPGGERGVLPGEYAYTLRKAVLKDLGKGSYRFHVVARAPRQATPTEATSPPFEVP